MEIFGLLQFVREREQELRESLRRRGEDERIDEVLKLDKERRRLVAEIDSLRAELKAESRRIGRSGGKPEASEIERLRELRERVSELEGRAKEIEAKLGEILLHIPNVVHPSVPQGRDESENVVVRYWGEPRDLGFKPLPHWEIGERLGFLDTRRGVKLSGSRFHVLRDKGARLERALINWMLDLHVKEHNYTEIWLPYLVKREVMEGTGQLPKFEEDMYHCEVDDLYLIPTAEVPLVNLHRDEILEPGSLPIKYVAFSPCFRREAGAAGRETKGLIRVHQFDKVELVKIVEPRRSYEELEELVEEAAEVLRRLQIPYRITLMCAGDVGFSAAKKYDIEAWFPGEGRYIEVSSCSNCEDFQARRANIRFRPRPGAKPEYVHTLNGSGLAIGRTLAAILENYQQPDGSIIIPEVLRPYMGIERILPPS